MSVVSGFPEPPMINAGQMNAGVLTTSTGTSSLPPQQSIWQSLLNNAGSILNTVSQGLTSQNTASGNQNTTSNAGTSWVIPQSVMNTITPVANSYSGNILSQQPPAVPIPNKTSVVPFVVAGCVAIGAFMLLSGKKKR